ncbi:MAG: hypothetical protein IKZ89_09900 [Bacteroidaceae bacterium]|nr:hypothetical protein [Bacteroidaceae bacterium]
MKKLENIVLLNRIEFDMKRIIFIMFCVVSPLLSCDKNSNETAEYYVKYEMSATTRYAREERTILVNMENGVKKYDTDLNPFSETFGPFPKGFNANISINYKSGESAGSTTTILKIYVARGQEPFSLKAETISSSKTVSVSYIIDY